MLAEPKARSKTWLSTCYALDTEDPAAALCGPEYHVRPCSGVACLRGGKSCCKCMTCELEVLSCSCKCHGA